MEPFKGGHRDNISPNAIAANGQRNVLGKMKSLCERIVSNESVFTGLLVTINVVKINPNTSLSQIRPEVLSGRPSDEF